MSKTPQQKPELPLTAESIDEGFRAWYESFMPLLPERIASRRQACTRRREGSAPAQTSGRGVTAFGE